MEPEQLYGRWCDHKTAPQQAGPFKDSLFFTVSQFKNVGRFGINRAAVLFRGQGNRGTIMNYLSSASFTTSASLVAVSFFFVLPR